MKDFIKNLGRVQAEMIELLKSLKIEGSAGGGMVKIVMDGEQNIISVKIEPEVIQSSDIEMIQDLVRAAFNDAQQKVRNQVREQLSKKTGLPFGLPI